MRDVGENALRHFSKPQVQGRLRLGVAEAFARSLLTRVLSDFLPAVPDYETELSCETNSGLLVDLAEDRFDLVLINRTSGDDGELLRRLWLDWVGRAGLRLPVVEPIPQILDTKREPPPL